MIARSTTCSLFCVLISLFSVLPATSQNCDSIDAYKRHNNITRLEEGTFSFGLNFFQTTNRLQKKNANVCISPFSAEMALSMTLNGAEGETLKEMLATLGFSGLTPDEVDCAYREIMAELGNTGTDLQFENANSIWIRKGLPVHDEFIALNQSVYNAEVSTLDFADSKTSKKINGWVKEKTKGKIAEIVPDALDPATMMYLINAIYFKGMWGTQFDKEATHKEEFTLPGGKKIKHDLMKVEGEFSYNLSNDSTQMITLPYKGGNEKFRMVVILPAEGKDINDYIQGFDGKSFLRMIKDAGRGRKGEGTLLMPKFKLEYDGLLNDALIDMGMKRAFVGDLDPSANAEFGRISDKLLYISKVKQKTFVEVNEEGTEAAAVTSVEMDMPLSPEPPHLPFVMRVDRPFLFLIISSDPSTILFFGKVVDPRGE